MLLGCLRPPPYAEYTLVAPDESVFDLVLLGPTRAAKCEEFSWFATDAKGFWGIVDREYAVEEAIRKVSGATVLVDAEVTRPITSGFLKETVCIYASGTAAAFAP